MALEVELSRCLGSSEVSLYHCTKERHPGFFESNGIRTLNIQTHVREFMDLFRGRMDRLDPTLGPVFESVYAD